MALAFPFNFIVFWWFMTGFLDILVLGGGTLYSAIILYHITRKYYPLTLSPDEAEKLSETFPWKRKGGGALSRMGQRMRDIEERE